MVRALLQDPSQSRDDSLQPEAHETRVVPWTAHNVK